MKNNKFIQFAASGLEKVGQHIRRNGKIYAIVAITAAGSLVCRADTNSFDPMSVIDSAQTAFTAVAALVGSAVTLFVVIKVVKWIRK